MHATKISVLRGIPRHNVQDLLAWILFGMPNMVFRGLSGPMRPPENGFCLAMFGMREHGVSATV
jgi:hypothetical protein